MLLQRTNFLIVIIAHFAAIANANELPLQSGVVSSASEPVAIKTTPIKGAAVNRKGSIGQPVYLNDEIKTSESGKAQILLKDQSVFNIGPNSTLVIDKFIYDPQKSSMNVSIQKGAFKFVSGKIANSSDEAMKVQLPNATIAIRGTGVAGVVQPNGSATVMLLHGVVDVISSSSNSTSTLSKSGWGVQINPAGIISPPAPIPADVSRNLMLTSKVNQPASAASNSSAPATQNSSTSQNTTTSSAAGNTVAGSQLAPDFNTILAGSTANLATSTSNANNSAINTGTGVTQSNTATTLASSTSNSISNTNASSALNSGNSQLSSANSYLTTAQNYSSQAVTQSNNAISQKNTASTQASTASTQATVAANAALVLSADAIRAHELANAASTAAASASSLASSYSTSSASNANLAISASNSSSAAANSAISYANTATQQASSVVNNAASSASDLQTARDLMSQATTLNSNATSTNSSASTASTQASSASSSAQTAADQASTFSLAAAASALSAYQSASTVAQTLTKYEDITQTIANSGVLNPLGNITFTTTNVTMSCIANVNCGGGSATINSHSFVFNFQNATVTNNYNISYSNFNGYTGTISGNNSATAINWTSPTIVSLPVTGQVSVNPVSAAMDVVLTSVGTQNVTNRANLATVYTTINSGSAYMGVGNGYKILGK